MIGGGIVVNFLQELHQFLLNASPDLIYMLDSTGRFRYLNRKLESTFGYRQNLIVRPLTETAEPHSAMIEENFPVEAMTSDHAFYAAQDDATLQANMQAMLESCARFIDFDRIDVIPMSEYLLEL